MVCGPNSGLFMAIHTFRTCAPGHSHGLFDPVPDDGASFGDCPRLVIPSVQSEAAVSG